MPGLLLLGLLLGLGGCGGGQPARIPPSGVTGPNGGATETLYYDAAGKPHFQ